MIRSSQCVAVIPCLDEASTIEAVVHSVREHVPAVIVVDDGSTDDTGEAATRAGAEVIRHERTAGKGAALHTGWKRALERGFEWAFTLDGDGQHAPGDMPLFMAEAGEVSLIVGNRMTSASGMPWLRRQVNRWMSARLSKASGCELPDSQCGYRLMRLDSWCKVRLVTTHYEVESEVLLAFAAAGERIRFVPIQVIYKYVACKIHPARDTIRWFRWFLGRS